MGFVIKCKRNTLRLWQESAVLFVHVKMIKSCIVVLYEPL